MDTALLAELQSKRAGKRKSKPRGPPREAVAAQQLLAAKRAAARSDAASAKKGAHRVFVEALCALEAECGKGPAGKAKLASGLSMLLLYADTLITAAAANDAHAGRTIKVDASFHMRLGRLAASQQCLEALGFTLSTKRGGKQAYTAGHSIASIRCLRAMTTSKELLVLFSEGPSSRPSLDQRLRGLEAAAAKKAGGGGASGTLHVGGIQGDIEDETKLTELFSQFGAVETVTLRRRRGVKQGKQVVSWALVTFCAAESVARALEAHASLGSSHDLVVRTVDADQASGSTGAMSKVMQQHKSKFTALAQQRRQQRESAIDAQKPPPPPAAAPAATAKVPAARKEGMSLAELARQRKLEKQRQNSAAPASATASASASAPVPKKAKGNERTLHVGGIQGDIEDETKLTELFSQFGAVETVTLRRRRGVKQGKQVVSWALVTFCAAESVAQATGAQSMLQDAHALVVRAVDQKQAGESTGAMGSIIHLHANKFLELAKQRKKQRLEKDLQTMMFGGGGGTATAGSGNEVKKQAPGTRPPLLPSAAAATVVPPPPPPPPPLQLGHLLAVGRDTERDGGGGGGGAAHGSDFSSGRTPTKARSAPLSPTSPLISAQLSPASAAQLNIHGSPRRSNAIDAGQPDSSSTSRVLLGLGGLVSDGNGDTESGGSSSMFAPSGVAPGGMVKVTEVKALTALDQQLQAALEVVQLHRDKPAVQTAAFTAIWNLTARSKKTTAAAASAAGAQLLGGQLPSAGNIASGGSATDAINLMIIQEALHTVDQHTRQTAAADGVALLLLLHLQAAALGALWSVLHRGESSAALGMEMRGVQQQASAAAAARSNRAEHIVTAAMAAAAAAAARSGRGTATCSGAGEGARRVVEFGECVLECL